MNFIAKHIQLMGVLLLTGTLAAAAAMYWGVPPFDSSGPSESSHPITATCDHGGQTHARCSQPQAGQANGSCCPSQNLPACPVTGQTGRTMVD